MVVLIKNLKNNEKGITLKSTTIKILCFQSNELSLIFQKSRNCILAGGTMEPIQPLVSILKNSNISYTYSRYPHIIEKSQCTVTTISKSNPNFDIKFTHKNLKQHLKQTMAESLSVIKGIVEKTEKRSGIVIFIQNYQLLEEISQYLGNIFMGISVFYDSRDKNNDIFGRYEKQIKEKKNSAILVSVMGGKLSEGINFSD